MYIVYLGLASVLTIIEFAMFRHPTSRFDIDPGRTKNLILNTLPVFGRNYSFFFLNQTILKHFKSTFMSEYCTSSIICGDLSLVLFSAIVTIVKFNIVLNIHCLFIFYFHVNFFFINNVLKHAIFT